MRGFAVGIGFLIALGALFWGYSGTGSGTTDPDQPDPEFLATDMHFVLGGRHMTLPAVAVSDVSIPPDNANPLPGYQSDPHFWGEPRWFQTRKHKDAFVALAGDPSRPANVSRLDLLLSGYGNYGDSGIFRKLCPLLTHDWSRAICEGTPQSELDDLPRRANLLNRDGLATLRNYGLSGIEHLTLADLVATMPMDSPVPAIACTRDQAVCYAGSRLAPDIFAVWELPGGATPTDREALALREGAALAAVLPLWLD
jgi:hypothetical protein